MIDLGIRVVQIPMPLHLSRRTLTFGAIYLDGICLFWTFSDPSQDEGRQDEAGLPDRLSVEAVNHVAGCNRR